jgi:hypothetical protein
MLQELVCLPVGACLGCQPGNQAGLSAVYSRPVSGLGGTWFDSFLLPGAGNSKVVMRRIATSG